jgi:hypothetical protein
MNTDNDLRYMADHWNELSRTEKVKILRRAEEYATSNNVAMKAALNAGIKAFLMSFCLFFAATIYTLCGLILAKIPLASIIPYILAGACWISGVICTIYGVWGVWIGTHPKAWKKYSEAANGN